MLYTVLNMIALFVILMLGCRMGLEHTLSQEEMTKHENLSLVCTFMLQLKLFAQLLRLA